MRGGRGPPLVSAVSTASGAVCNKVHSNILELPVDVVAKHKNLSKKLYVSGAFVASRGPSFPVINPATEDVIGEVAEAAQDEIAGVIAEASAAQKKWWALAGAERADIMHEVTRATRTMVAPLAESLTREQGKTYKEAVDEIGWCASAMSYYAEISRHEGGRVHGPSAPGQLHLTMKEPLGVVVSIVPFNYPYLLLFWQVAAAVGAGNAVIIKPSEYTSLSTLFLMEAFAALPPGLVQCVTGRGPAGQYLVEHDGVHGVAFTGSLKTSQIVAQACARSFKPALIEASGNDPFIVMPSAPIDISSRGVAFASFLNAGQVCTSAERIYVHEKIHDEFADHLAGHAKALRVGNGLSRVDMGPMVSARERDRYEAILARAIQQGAKVACGGGRPKSLNTGWFTDATVLTGVTADMDIVNDESFGPVAPPLKCRALTKRSNWQTAPASALAQTSTRKTSVRRCARSTKSNRVWFGSMCPCSTTMPCRLAAGSYRATAANLGSKASTNSGIRRWC